MLTGGEISGRLGDCARSRCHLTIAGNLLRVGHDTINGRSHPRAPIAYIALQSFHVEPLPPRAVLARARQARNRNGDSQDVQSGGSRKVQSRRSAA
jgi:hypothetical protein